MRTARSWLATALSTALSTGSMAAAQTIAVPPVEITGLIHSHTVGVPPAPTQTRDATPFPCTGMVCDGPGFTASIGQGSMLVVRFQAPAGHRFAVTRAPGGSQYFVAEGYWGTRNADTGSHFSWATFEFESLWGAPPVGVFDWNLVSDSGEYVWCWNEFRVDGDFSFTALVVRFPVNHALVGNSRSYLPVDAFAPYPFGSVRLVNGVAGDTTLMRIEPMPGSSFCFGDGTGAPCPCGNSGSAGRGCQNSSFTGGAQLMASGTVGPDTVVLAAMGEKPTALTIFLQGTQTMSPLTFGDGLRCIQGTLKRLYSRNAVGGTVTAPQGADLPITVRSAQMGDPIAPGSTRHYMTFYRDPVAAFCPGPSGSNFNGSNGLSIVW